RDPHRRGRAPRHPAALTRPRPAPRGRARGPGRRTASTAGGSRPPRARSYRASARGVGHAVGAVLARGSRPDADGGRRALESGVVPAVRALARADVREDLLQAALRAERDEGRALGVARVTGDRHGARVAPVVVVVAAAVDGTLDDLRHLREAAHRDLLL